MSFKCQICSIQAHGSHFGVLTCRACAAFFRRIIVYDNQHQLKCKTGEQNCEIVYTQRQQCRYCRYMKCIDSGMTPDNVQWNRDSIKPRNKEMTDALSFQADSFKKVLKPKTTFDLTEITQKVRKILDNHDPTKNNPSLSCLNQLEQLDFNLRQWRGQQIMSEEKLTFLGVTPVNHVFKIFEDQMYTVAEWLVHDYNFRQLPSNEKYLFFKSVWNIWRRFERFDMSIQVFGQRCFNEKIVVISPIFAVKNGEFEIDFSQITDISNEQIRGMFDLTLLQLFDKVSKPLFSLKPSSLETTYMLIQTCWQVASKHSPGPIHDKTDLVRDQLANDLHEYYRSVNRTNYAGRLVQLMNVVNSVEKIHLKRKQLMELARLFEVFKIDFSDPEMFNC